MTTLRILFMFKYTSIYNLTQPKRGAKALIANANYP